MQEIIKLSENPEVKPETVSENTVNTVALSAKEIIKNEPNVIMKNRAVNALNKDLVLNKVILDYTIVFKNIGLDEEEANKLAIRITNIIKSPITLKESEEEILEIFQSIHFNGKSFFENLKDKIKDRTQIIVPQLEGHLQGIKGKVIDYGAGSGLNAQGLHEKLGLDIECIDIRDFKHPSVDLPIKILNENGKVPVEDNYYEAGTIINVLHHEKDNEKILEELTRIVQNRLVVIETVPGDDTHEEMERTFLNDVLWNRYFNYANIPVPGAFLRPNSWIERFEKHGWKLQYQEDLGYNQPTIQDIHHLFVFVKE